MSQTNGFATLSRIPLLQKLYAVRKLAEAVEQLYTRALQGPIIGPVSGQPLTPALDPGSMQLLESETNTMIDQIKALATTLEPVSFTSGIKPVGPVLEPIIEPGLSEA